MLARADPSKAWTAEEFLTTDQSVFGHAWRYELVDGVVIAPDAPAPDHGAILAGRAAALGTRLRGNKDGCRPEAGSGAVAKTEQRNTARIPDVTVRCGERPRIVFEIISPSELTHWRDRDRKMRDLQAVEGVAEIVEIYQGEMAVHVHRKTPDGQWTLEAIGGPDAILMLPSIGLSIPLGEIYEFAPPAPEPAG